MIPNVHAMTVVVFFVRYFRINLTDNRDFANVVYLCKHYIDDFIDPGFPIQKIWQPQIVWKDDSIHNDFSCKETLSLIIWMSRYWQPRVIHLLIVKKNWDFVQILGENNMVKSHGLLIECSSLLTAAF